MAEQLEQAKFFQILSDTAVGIDRCVQALASSFPPPHRIAVQDGRIVFRHGEKDDLLLSFLKLVKIASHHNAAMILMREGYVQEGYALCRMIDEAGEDIFFMAKPLGNDGQPSADQRRFIEEFFQEEFTGPDLVTSHQSRDRVPRRKVRAANSRLTEGNSSHNPSRDLQATSVLTSTFSGFVHGAYVHIMELFGGPQLRFHTRGMLGTPRMQEGLRNHVHHAIRTLFAVELVAGRAGREDVVYAAVDLSLALAREINFLKPEVIASLERRRAISLVKPS